MRLILLTLSFALCLMGCDRGAPASRNVEPEMKFVAASGSILNRFGELASPDGSLVVNAERNSVSIVNYTVSETESNSVFANGGGFSDAQRWFLYFDSSNQL